MKVEVRFVRDGVRYVADIEEHRDDSGPIHIVMGVVREDSEPLDEPDWLLEEFASDAYFEQIRRPA